MPVYMYKVSNASGKILTGEANVGSASELTDILVGKGFKPIDIKEKNALNDVSQMKLFKKRVTVKDMAVFCRQFAIVLEAGIPIATALDVLREQTTNKTLKDALQLVYENIQKGIPLSNSMKQQGDIFPEILINMVEAGEVSGQLDLVFARMATQFEKDYKLNHRVKGALTYPIVISIVAVIVVTILMAFVLPSFISVLDSFDTELPIYTKILMAITAFFQNWWWAILLVFGTSVFAISRFVKTDAGKSVLGTLAISVPIVKGVVKNVITARFARTLGTLLSSGVLLIQALQIVQKVLGNKVIADRMDTVIEEVKRGKGLSQPLIGMKYFPPMVLSMVRIGEESGDLDSSLDKSADFFDQEVETSLASLTTLIEPLIIIVLALGVGFIVISILAPMFSLYQTLSV